MPNTLSAAQLRSSLALLIPSVVAEAHDDLFSQLAAYLDLLLRWNERMNLTSVREPEAIISRHFAESLFAAQHLPPTGTLLDLGSGAGFPGLPIQLLRPALQITLSESQGKKAAFLREAIRVLGVSASVFPHRAESLPPGANFDVVTLRAVDRMLPAVELAATLATSTLCVLTGADRAASVVAAAPAFFFAAHPLPHARGELLLGTRSIETRLFHVEQTSASVPRGTPACDTQKTPVP